MGASTGIFLLNEVNKRIRNDCWTTFSGIIPGQMWGWGWNADKQLTLSIPQVGVPTQLNVDTDWGMLTAGSSHSLGIKNNGELWGWGSGIASGTGVSTLLQIGVDVDWKFVSAGVNTSAAIKNNGDLYTWGRNVEGAVGDGTNTNRTTPVFISGGWKYVTQGTHTVALKTNGELWAWGKNFTGQLGDGTTINKNTPTLIDNTSTWISISAGNEFTMGVKSDGTLWGWGNGNWGKLGNGSTSNLSVPTQSGSDTDWVRVECGNTFAAGLKTDGTLWAWGSNSYGQLGNGTIGGTSAVPVQVGTSTDWADFDVGGSFIVTLKDNGTIVNWGSNFFNSLGDGGTANNPNPTQVGVDSDWLGITAGAYHTLARKQI